MKKHNAEKHGMSKTPTYKSWDNMKARCTRPNKKGFEIYSKLGFDASWSKFQNFFNDMGIRPINTTLDRIDNTKGYFKTNCRWATIYQQASNKKNSNPVVGVVRDRKYFSARIQVKKKFINLGSFKKYEDAVKARKEAEDKWITRLPL